MNKTIYIHDTPQGMLYRSPIISRRLLLITAVTLFVSNFIGVVLFGFHLPIAIISLLVILALYLFKRLTDGKMENKPVPAETAITFSDDSLSISIKFTPEVQIEDFVCFICHSDSSSNVQQYSILYSDILRIYNIEETQSYIIIFRAHGSACPVQIGGTSVRLSNLFKDFISAPVSGTIQDVYRFLTNYSSSD